MLQEILKNWEFISKIIFLIILGLVFGFLIWRETENE